MLLLFVQIEGFDHFEAIARIQQIALLQEPIEGVVTPFRAIESPVPACRLDRGLALDACTRLEDMFRERIEMPQMIDLELG